MLGVFALIGCGEKKKSIDTAEGGQDAGPVQEANEEVEVASSGPEPLISAAEVERFVKDAHNGNKSSPPADYTGWVKEISGTELYALSQWKNGKGDGPCYRREENTRHTHQHRHCAHGLSSAIWTQTANSMCVAYWLLKWLPSAGGQSPKPA